MNWIVYVNNVLIKEKFDTFQLAVAHVKQKYSSAWQANRVKITQSQEVTNND